LAAEVTEDAERIMHGKAEIAATSNLTQDQVLAAKSHKIRKAVMSPLAPLVLFCG
jgi:hypothetical protein